MDTFPLFFFKAVQKHHCLGKHFCKLSLTVKSKTHMRISGLQEGKKKPITYFTDS